MSRNFILFVIVAVIAGRVSICLNGSGGVAQGQTSTEQPVLQDNFDDNKKGTPWKIFGETAKAKATEVNKRLEFTTTADVNVPFVGYISDRWWIDPNQDFRMKVDLYFDIAAYNSDGWISFGVTPNANQPGDRYVALGVGCSGFFKNYWREWRDGYEVRVDFAGRVRSLVTLYMYYDSWYDVLYLSDTGYDPDSAWQVLPGLVRGRWGRVPLYVFLGAKTKNLTIMSGNAHLDNFVIEKGKLGSPYNDPTQPPGGGGGGQVLDVAATLAVVPSVIQRRASGDKLTVLVGLPQEIGLADWDPANVPTLSPGGIAANAQTAFVWVDNTVKILASFSKTKLMQAIPSNGLVEVHVVGQLKDGRSYAGSSPVTIQ
jgi:hypothetical protein